MSQETPQPPLFWEDETASSGRWWFARARETVPEGHIDYFIAEDDLTAAFVAVALLPSARNYTVIGVAPFGTGASGSAIMAAKTAVTAWRGGDRKRWAIYRWRFARFARLIERDLPLALAGFVAGVVLGLVMAFIASSSQLGGSALVIAGAIIGACAGPALKVLVNRDFESPHPRPWARFAVATVSAVAGAIAAAAVTLTIYWS
ncbi:MAG: hypothetical protein K1X51_18750 [Rhodospirillaceae bacterium]|nr:hypothetical protein [Rhodospirillaceae bacterium]